jgi:hypothetical protein
MSPYGVPTPSQTPHRCIQPPKIETSCATSDLRRSDADVDVDVDVDVLKHYSSLRLDVDLCDTQI